MKKIVFLSTVLVVAVAVSAETFKWSYRADYPSSFLIGEFRLDPDGGGGCVLSGSFSEPFVPGQPERKSLVRILWLDALGRVIFTNDFRLQQNGASVRRVTKTDVYINGTEYFPESGSYSNFIIRAQRKGATVAVVATDVSANELLVPRFPLDTKGFFTVELLRNGEGDSTAIMVRRYVNK